LADDNIRMLKVETGEIDIATDVPFNQIDKLSAMPNLTVQLTPYDRIDWIQFNEKLDKFQDVKVRQAMNWAVDKEGIISRCCSVTARCRRPSCRRCGTPTPRRRPMATIPPRPSSSCPRASSRRASSRS